MSKVGDYVRLTDNHDQARGGYGYRGSEEDEAVKLYKRDGSLRDTSDIGVVLSKSGSDITVESFTRLTDTSPPTRIRWTYKESSLVKIEAAVNRQLQWFFRVQGGQAAGSASAGAPINSQDIAEGAFFGFGPNERDDLLHMMFLCLCLGKGAKDSVGPPPFSGGKMTLTQFRHGLSLVGNPTSAAELKQAMEAFETQIRPTWKAASGSYRDTEGSGDGAYRRFWDNMYWVFWSIEGLKFPQLIVNKDFKKQGQLFVPCLKIGLDLLPADFPHKKELYEFMTTTKAREFQAQAVAALSDKVTRQNFTMAQQGDKNYDHYLKCFSECTGTLAAQQWQNVWLLSKLGPAPEFSGYSSYSLDTFIMDFLKSKGLVIPDDDDEDD